MKTVALLIPLMFVPALGLADVFDTGCPCSAWPAGTCSAKSISFTVKDPMPGGGRECGNNGTATISITLDKSYKYGCYADGYHIWIEDDGTGVDVVSTNGARHMVDPLVKGHPNSGPPWSGGSGAGRDLAADQNGRPTSFSIIETPGYSNMNMSSGCGDGNYGGSRLAYTFTAVPAVPQDNGATVIRPSWAGTVKEFYSTNDIDWGILPSFNANDSGMPSLKNPTEVIRRCVTDAYFTTSHAAGGAKRFGDTTIGQPVFNFQQYHTDAAFKFSVCGATMAFSQGSNAPTLAQRKTMMIGMVTNGAAMLDAMKHGEKVTYTLNSGYGQNAELPLLFLHAAFPAKRAAFKNRFSQALGNSGEKGYEIATDTGTWRHPNGQAYYGGPFSTPGGLSGWPCAGKNSTSYSQGNSCRDVNGNPDDIHGTRGGGYQTCCSTGAWFSILGVVYAFPTLVDIYLGNNNAGEKWFDYMERFNAYGQIRDGGVKGLTKGGLAHKEGTGEGLYNAIRSCSVSTTGSGASTQFASFNGNCAGHGGSTPVDPPAGVPSPVLR